MTRYQRSRLHDEVAAYLSFWDAARESVTETVPADSEPDPWRHLKECIAILRGAQGWEDAA